MVIGGHIKTLADVMKKVLSSIHTAVGDGKPSWVEFEINEKTVRIEIYLK